VSVRFLPARRIEREKILKREVLTLACVAQRHHPEFSRQLFSVSRTSYKNAHILSPGDRTPTDQVSRFLLIVVREDACLEKKEGEYHRDAKAF
jgi:hypothetical protein